MRPAKIQFSSKESPLYAQDYRGKPEKANKFQRYMSGQQVKDSKMFRSIGQDQVTFSRDIQEKYQPKILKSPIQDQRLSRERSPPQRLSSSNHSYLAARNTESQERVRSKERVLRENQEIDFYPRDRSGSKPKYSELPSNETSSNALYTKSIGSNQRSQFQSQNQYLGLQKPGFSSLASSSLNQNSRAQRTNHQISLYDENLIAQSHQQSIDYQGVKGARMESEPNIITSQSDEQHDRLNEFAKTRTSLSQKAQLDVEGVAVNLQQKMYGIENKYLALVDYYKKRHEQQNRRVSTEVDNNIETQLIDGLLKEKYQFKQELENLASCQNAIQFSQEDTRMQETLKLFQKENEDLKQLLNNTMGGTSPINFNHILKSSSTLQNPLQVSSDNIKQSVFEELRVFEKSFLEYINVHYNTFTERDVTEMLNELADKLINRIESLQLPLVQKSCPVAFDADTIEQTVQDFNRELEQLELQNGYNQQNLKKHLFALKNKHDTVKLDLKRALRQVEALGFSNQRKMEYESIDQSVEQRRMRAFASDEKRSSFYHDSANKQDKENQQFGVQGTIKDIQERLRECEVDFQQIGDVSQAFSSAMEAVKENYQRVINEVQVQLVMQRGGQRHAVFTPQKQNYLLEDQVKSLKDHNSLLQEQLQKAELRAQKFEQSPTRREPLIRLEQKRASSVDPTEAYFDRRKDVEQQLHERIQDMTSLIRDKDYQIDQLNLKLKTFSHESPHKQTQTLEGLLDYTQRLNHQNLDMLVNMIRHSTRFLNAMKRLQKAVHRKESDVRAEKQEFELNKKELEKAIKDYRAQVELNDAQKPLKERSLVGQIHTQFSKFQKHATGSSHQIRRDLYSKLSAQSQSIDPGNFPQEEGRTPQKREKSPISLRTLHLSKTSDHVFRSIEPNPTNAFSVEKDVRQELQNLTEEKNQLAQELQDKDDFIASLKLDLQHQKTVNEREKQKYESVKQNLKEVMKEKEELIMQMDSRDLPSSTRDSGQLEMLRQIEALKRQNQELEKKSAQMQKSLKAPFDLQPLSETLKQKIKDAQREIEERVQAFEEQLNVKVELLQKTKKSLEKKIKEKDAKMSIQKNQELQQAQEQLQKAQKDYQAKLADEQENNKRASILQNSLQKLQTDLQLKEQSIAQLTKQLKQVQEQEEKTQNDIQKMQESHYQQLQKQKEETREKDRQKKELQEQIQNLRSDQEATMSSMHSQRQDKVQELQEQLEKTQRDLQVAQQKLQQTEQDLEQAIQDNQELQDELKEVETQSNKSQQVQNLQFVINSLQQEKQAMIVKIQSLHQQHKQAQQNIQLLQHQIQREQQQNEHEKQESEQKLAQMQQRLSDLQQQEQMSKLKESQQVQELERRLREAEIDQNSKQETIQRLQAQLSNVSQGKDQSQQELTQLIEQTTKQKQEIQTQLQLLQGDHSKLQNQYLAIQEQCKQEQDKVQRQKQELKDIQKEIKAKKAEVSELQMDLAKQVGQNQNSIMQYEQALNQSREQLRQTEQQIQYLQQQTQQSEKLIEKQEEDLEIKDSQLTALQKEIERISSEKDQTESGLISSQRQREKALNAQIEERQAQIEHLMEEQLKVEKNLSQKLKDIEKQKLQQELELEQAISDNQELQFELKEQEQKHKEQLESLQQQEQTHKEQLESLQKQDKQQESQQQKHIQELESQLNALNFEKRGLELQKADQEKKIAKLQEEAMQKKSEAEQSQQRRFEERETQLQEQLQKHQREILLQKKEVQEAQKECKQLVQEFNDLATEKNQLLQSYKDAQANNQILSQSLEKGKEMIELLQERLKTALEQTESSEELKQQLRQTREQLKEKEEELALKKEELEENEAMMERVNEAIEEHNRENHELKARCKFLTGLYRKEVEDANESASEYKEGEAVDVVEFFELMQDVLEQFRIQKEEKIIMLEGMLEKGKAEMEALKTDLQDKNRKMQEMQAQLEGVLSGMDANDQDVRQKLAVAMRKIQNYKDKLGEKTQQFQELEEKHKKVKAALERPIISPRNQNLEKENLRLIQQLRQAEEQLQEARKQEQTFNSDASLQLNLEKIKEVEAQVIDLKTRIYAVKEEAAEQLEKQHKVLLQKQKQFMDDIISGAQTPYDDFADQWANRSIRPCLRFTYGGQRFVLCQQESKYRLLVEGELNEKQKQVLYSYLSPLADSKVGVSQKKQVEQFQEQMKQIEEERGEIMAELHAYKKKFLVGRGDESVSESVAGLWHRELELKFLEQEDDIAHWTAEHLELREKLKQLAGQNLEQKQRICELNQMVNELLADQGEPEEDSGQLREVLEQNQLLQDRLRQLEDREEHKQLDRDLDDSFLADIRVVQGTLEGEVPQRKRIPVSEREVQVEPSFSLENEAKLSQDAGGAHQKIRQLEQQLEHEKQKNKSLTHDQQALSKAEQEVEVAQIKGTFLPFIRGCPVTRPQNEMILQAVFKMLNFSKQEIEAIQQHRQGLDQNSANSEGGDTDKKKKGLMGLFKGGKKPDSRPGSSTRSVQSPSPIKPLGRR